MHPIACEFHISRASRDRYQFDETLFSLSGNVLFANFHSVRLFAQKMNQKRDPVNFPEQAVRAGQIHAMGLIDEILHFVFGLYRQEHGPLVMEQAVDRIDERLGKEAVDKTLRRFVGEFPPVAVYRGQTAPEAYLEGETDGVPHRLMVLEEMLMLWLANMNPAFSPFLELFDDTALERETAYREIISGLHSFFDALPPFGPERQNLIDMLRSPAVAAPHSLSGQLEYIREKWAYLLGRHIYRLLGGLDFLKEEEKMGFLGPGPALVYEFKGLELDPERFSPDRDWMPRVVMIAKNTHVWLDQLSRKYQRPITRLDQVPDEELNAFARWGFSALWLIGLWERSRASQKIKQMCGNPDAVASAYSLYDYRIAADLGGEEAYRDLKDRAGQRGIRLASDMVPNHVGIDGRWVIEHPDWFVALDYSPFPSYTFNGPDLSQDDRVGLFLEDHYYARSDAAVVFKRTDRWTGSEKYIYHGNDGTSMPWNDTAQLDYLNPEVREAVIQTILHVARLFPIIRFDAAMTLTKKHYQRLWFPEPGTGGAIPSRAEHGLTRAEINARMPAEFWREVVDRVAREVPDTLLLAEAFWLMEGYFVRTLGMHRVYNSAFMNMLKNEENANYRSVIKNTLEFDPKILQRFVNFMNNPDEETAIAQFGKDDKYFGVCMMMITMPGLPMFGHGQVEGFSEKYGMEYRRAYWDEPPDPYLIRRHEREIFPLMHRRRIFAGAENFLLYDCFTPEGHVNEDVFAYSNRFGEERALVVYHNRYARAKGWIRTSVGYLAGTGDNRSLTSKNLGEGLGLRPDPGSFCIFRDHVAGLEFIRNSRDLFDKGLYVDLGAYKYHVFLDFREVWDDESHHWSRLTAYLDGYGVPSIDEALREIILQPIHHAFEELVNAHTFRPLMDARTPSPDGDLLDEIEGKMHRLLEEISRFTGGGGDKALIARQVRREMEAVMKMQAGEGREVAAESDDSLPDGPFVRGSLLGWLAVHALGRVAGEEGFEEQSRSWIDEWLLGRIISGALRDCGLEEQAASQAMQVIRLLTSHQRWFTKTDAYQVLESLLQDSEVQQFLRVNRHQGVLWFSKEAFEQLLGWLRLLTAVAAESSEEESEAIRASDRLLQDLRGAEEDSGYQVDKLLAALKD